MGRKITQSELIMEYFKSHSDRDIEHPEIVDWATSEYKKRTGKEFRDPDRAIRKLFEDGKLIKVSKGCYKYDPNSVEDKKLEDFTQAQKKEIFKRGEYKCAICGLGEKEGVELQIDHIKPKEKGGKAELSNGQVLCGTHNNRKKTYNQTESGKKMFMNLWKLSKKEGDKEMKKFCEAVLQVYEKHDINGHIEWKKS